MQEAHGLLAHVRSCCCILVHMYLAIVMPAWLSLSCPMLTDNCMQVGACREERAGHVDLVRVLQCRLSPFHGPDSVLCNRAWLALCISIVCHHRACLGGELPHVAQVLPMPAVLIMHSSLTTRASMSALHLQLQATKSYPCRSALSVRTDCTAQGFGTCMLRKCIAVAKALMWQCCMASCPRGPIVKGIA